MNCVMCGSANTEELTNTTYHCKNCKAWFVIKVPEIKND